MPNHKAEVSDAAIYSPERLQKLVPLLWNSREEPAIQSVLFYVALGAFAGLRPAEAVALEWKYIDWIRQEIHLGPPIVKTARTIPIKENLLAILLPFKGRNGPVIIHKKVANLFRNECAQAGVKHIPNGLRRSYAVYRLGEAPDETVQSEMGSEAAALPEQRKISADEVVKYWAVRP
jgi:integrase